MKKKLMPKGAIQSRTDFGADGHILPRSPRSPCDGTTNTKDGGSTGTPRSRSEQLCHPVSGKDGLPFKSLKGQI